MAVPQCPNRKCQGHNIIRLNPLEKTPQWKCLTCKLCFIEQKDRIKLLIVIDNERPELKEIDRHGVINERIFEFWRRTNPTFDRYARMMLEETENLCELLTPATTIDRDARRQTDGNDDGLNETYRKEQAIIDAHLA